MMLAQRRASAQWSNQPEKGAKLRVLRWKRFVQGDEEQFMANVEKFTAGHRHRGAGRQRGLGGPAAQGGGRGERRRRTRHHPGWYDDAHLYPDKLVDVTDLAQLSRQEVRRLVSGLRAVLRPDGKNGSAFRWARRQRDGLSRKPAQGRRLRQLPEGPARLPASCARPSRQRARPAVSRSATPAVTQSWAHWLVWAFGGKLVDEKNQVVINSPETLTALEYAKELYQTFVPGTLSWHDPSNNKAFLDSQISVTINGISIYYAAKNSQDPKLKAMAEDIQHANFPIGPVGDAHGVQHLFNQMIFKYTQVPECGQGLHPLHDGARAVRPVAEGVHRLRRHPLRAYDANPIWTVDPKHMPYRDAMKNMRPVRLCRNAGLRLGGGHGRLHHRRHGRGGGERRQDRPRTPPTARRSARSATTRSELGPFPPPCSLKSSPPRAAASWPDCCTIFRATATCWAAVHAAGGRAAAAVPHLPARLGIWLGFTDATIGRPGEWIGLENYSFLLQDEVTQLARCSTPSSTQSSRACSSSCSACGWRCCSTSAAVQGVLPRGDPAALHRADRALGDRLLVDLRLAVLA